MKKIFSLIICTFSFAEDINSIYQEAQNQENLGNYKEAMLLYKKVADTNISKEDRYILDLAKNQEHRVETFTTMKKSFIKNRLIK